jgi:uncharacterized Fe-S radical SAM superfamily protein PflX
MTLPKYSTLDDLIDIYVERMNIDNKNIERIKEFYCDEKSFTSLMNRIIEKDLRRFNKLFCESSSCDITRKYNGSNGPNVWRVLYVILDIVQHEGEEIEPFDVLTKTYPSRTIMYYGWTFSWVHGENTLISIFDRNDELVYRF